MEKFVQYSQVPPVVDGTGLKGSWDFKIQLPTTQPRNSPETTALLRAVETIGLNIAPRTSPQPAIIVDSVNEQPGPEPARPRSGHAPAAAGRVRVRHDQADRSGQQASLLFQPSGPDEPSRVHHAAATRHRLAVD